MIEIENVIILQKEKGRFDKFCPISKFKDLPEAGDMFEDMMEIAKSIHSSIKLQTDEPVEILIQDNNYLVSCVSYQGELKESDDFSFSIFQSPSGILGYTLYKKREKYLFSLAMGNSFPDSP